MYDSYVLTEAGLRVLLEDGSGDVLTEQAVPVVTPSGGIDDGHWYMARQLEALARNTPRKRQRPQPRIELMLDREDWTDDELTFLLSLDVLEV